MDKFCKTSLTRCNLSEVEKTIDCFCEEIRSACNSLYEFDEEGETCILERCHFDQCDAELVLTMYWYKTPKNGNLTGRYFHIQKCIKCCLFYLHVILTPRIL